jgi:cyclopropane-fatty-acyl-phospholipid synthase
MNIITPSRRKAITAAQSSRWARVLAPPFHKILDRIDAGLVVGAIETILPDGTFRLLGGHANGPLAKVTIHRWRALVRLWRSGSVGWYEGWATGDWDSHDPVPLFDLFSRNRTTLGGTARASGLSRIGKWLSHQLRRNDRKGARKNILAHYDLGNDFYREWLDETMSYSSAIFAHPINGEETLEAAQKRKTSALGKRLKLKTNAAVLELGSGWGFFAKVCAQKGHRVTAITLSPAQKQWAEGKAKAKAMSNPPIYRLLDYRDVTGSYDAIASVEMAEAVGKDYWPAYLDMIDRCLKPGGRAAIQFISIADDVFDAYARSADFIQTYIFPGGMLLSESRFRALAEARGLGWEEPQHFGLHYAETLRRWRVRFDDAVEEGRLPAIFDARFIRLWRYYLMYCEGGFRGGGIEVTQVTLVKS